MIKDLKIRGEHVRVDISDDYYGEDFWAKISVNKWEPDTFDFIATYCDSSAHFLDIGAANGAMSLAAAICGATVTSYEPDPVIFSVLQRNVEMNEKLNNRIELKHVGVSSESGVIDFDVSSDPEIFSGILFRNRTFEKSQIGVLGLAEEVSRYGLLKKKLVIKMDIEGAEFKILNNLKVLKALEKFDVLLLLAIHPGFNRQYKKSKFNRKISEKLWRKSNFRESLELFSAVQQFANIFRTNLNPVRNRESFARLVDSGYHEFVIDFSKNRI